MKYLKMMMVHLLLIIASIIVAIFVIFIPFGILIALLCGFSCLLVQYTPIYVAIPVLIIGAAILTHVYNIVIEMVTKAK